jgi:hypothetical protein
MKKISVLTLAFVLVSGIAGCGSAAKDQLAAINEMTSILDGIKDDKSAGDALPKLEKAADKAREAGEKVSSSKMSEGDATKYMKEVLDAQTKMQVSAVKACAAAKGKSKEIQAAIAKAQPKNIKMP